MNITSKLILISVFCVALSFINIAWAHDINNMLPPIDKSVLTITDKTLNVIEVTGGKDKSNSWDVDRKTYQEALIRALKSSGMYKEILLSSSEAVDYELQATITRSDVTDIGALPLFGIEPAVGWLDVQYILTDKKNGNVVWQEKISTSFKKKANYLIEKTNQMEGAIKENLNQLLFKMSDGLFKYEQSNKSTLH